MCVCIYEERLKEGGWGRVEEEEKEEGGVGMLMQLVTFRCKTFFRHTRAGPGLFNIGPLPPFLAPVMILPLVLTHNTSSVTVSTVPQSVSLFSVLSSSHLFVSV